MARTFANVCVFALIVLIAYSRPVAASDIRLDYLEFIELPEAEWAEEKVRLRESLSQPPCEFLIRHLVAPPSELQNIRVTSQLRNICPAETLHCNHQAGSSLETAWRNLAERCEALTATMIRTTARLTNQLDEILDEVACWQLERTRQLIEDIQNARPYLDEHIQPVNLPGTIEETESIEPDSDRYWQYYDDCDHWDVIFAMTTIQAQFDAACLPPTNVQPVHKNPVNRLVEGMATGNLLRTIGASNQLFGDFRRTINRRIRHQEFLMIETSGIRFSRDAKSLARSLQAGWECHVRAFQAIASEVRIGQFISLRRAYPANVLRSGRDYSSRFPSLR